MSPQETSYIHIAHRVRSKECYERSGMFHKKVFELVPGKSSTPIQIPNNTTTLTSATKHIPPTAPLRNQLRQLPFRHPDNTCPTHPPLPLPPPHSLPAPPASANTIPQACPPRTLISPPPPPLALSLVG
jgi:hypothetical protein